MRRRMAFVCAVLAMVATTISGTTAFAGNGGFTTARPSMLTPMKDGVTVTPLLTVGDVLPSGFRFESIPDGMSLRTRGKGRVDLYVNHETSKVPFPYTTANPMASNGQSDFDNSQVSHLILNQNSAGVLSGSFAIPSSGGFQRFCSNFLATAKEGFSRDILFTNEESPDYVFRQEDSWPPPVGDPNEEENGVTIAYDIKSRQYHTVYGMGRFNHENNVAVPGYDDLVVLSGDDTFTSGTLTLPSGPNPTTSAPAQSQLYSYIASDTDALLNDEGDLWAFVSDTPGVTNYYNFAPGSTQSITGHFIQVPKNIATGKDTDGSELMSSDLGYPAPDGGWQTDLRTSPAVPIDGPQWVLEYWSHLNHVFQFVRVEDIAYDKRPGMGNVVYFADTGRATLPAMPPLFGPGLSTNGRIWKMVLDPDDPTQVDSLSILLDGDDSPVKTLGEIHQPDNVETTSTGLLVTEDPGGNNQFPADSVDPNATTARLWYVPFSSPGSAQVVAKIDQSADAGPTDVGPLPTTDPSIGAWGTWETTGIVDASAAFGTGAYLINIQAHTLWIQTAPGADNFAPAGPDFTYKREGGQLLLIRIPGI